MKKFSFVLKFCSIFLFFNSVAYLQAYEPAILAGKYQTEIIDYDFYWRFSSIYEGGGGWMPKLAYYYSGCDDSNIEVGILGIRRTFVPGTMVDANGDLYNVTLCMFRYNGPIFLLTKYHYSNGEIQCSWTTYEPFPIAYDDGAQLDIGHEPYFGAIEGNRDEFYFKNCFHHTFNPCILQEIGESSDYVTVFHFIPTVRLVGTWYNMVTDFEGGLLLKFKKSDLSLNKVGKDNRGNNDNKLSFHRTPVNTGRNHPKAFTYRPGNFQGFHMGTYGWIVHRYTSSTDIARSEDVSFANVNAKTWVPEIIRYDISTLAEKERGEYGYLSGAETSSLLYPKFIRVGNHVYFGSMEAGWWFVLRRITPNLEEDNGLGTVRSRVWKAKPDSVIETTSTNSSIAPYNYDFCLLDSDGTPCSASSLDDGYKILCIFGFRGYTEAVRYWTNTYANWDCGQVVAVLSSLYIDTEQERGDIGNTTRSYAQNTVYVTDHLRGKGEYVDMANTTKTDEYRLYLNTHKMVPYTSPTTGKHYMIFAYCYPGKKQHLYLGYAQYMIDANHEMRVLTQTVFKAAGNNGWGDSFGAFTNCTRIISMDLRNGHLWITFMKETGTDATDKDREGKEAAAHFSYFHILASDLIQE